VVLGALSGFAIGVTAPAPSSEEHELLSSLGADVIVGSVLGSGGDLAPAERLLAVASAGGLDAVTFTSVEAVDNFSHLATSQGRLVAVMDVVARGTMSVACSGPAAAERARAIGFDCRIESPGPEPGPMLQALVADLTARSTTVRLRDGSELVLRGRAVVAPDGNVIRLTVREHAVLVALVRRAGAVVPKRTLLNEVWAGESDGHVVEVTIARLRRRLGPAGAAIETVLRRGYRLDAR
jgi:uroporphyrinogen-III synthase